jgi:CRP-like cAMP-binding protein
MLTGVHPFDVQGVSTDKEIEQAIQDNPRPPLDRKLIGHLSDSAVHLILRLMDPDPHTRISAYEMLNHPWVQGKTALKEKIADSDKKLSRFKDIRNKLEAGVFAMLVRQSHPDLRMSQDGDTTKSDATDEATQDVMHRAFSAFDADGKGFVSAEDLGRVAAELTGSDVDLEDTKEYVKATVTKENSGATTSSAEHALSLSDFNRLFSGLQHKHFPRGHYIFNAGDRGDAMYFLCSGKVEIQTRKEQLVSILRGGDFFGEGSLLQPDSKRFTSAKCSTPVDVIEIKRVDFDRYLGASARTKQDLHRKWRARSLTYAKNLLRLQTNVKVRSLKKGEVVYKEGDVGTSMYRVDDVDGGELSVSHSGKLVHKYLGGDSFGESSLIMKQPRSSTVTCTSKKCQLLEMKAEDFMAVIESSPELTTSLRDMCRKRLFKKAVQQYSLEKNRGLTDEDIVATFYEADIDKSGFLNLDEVRRIMHKMDPRFPIDEIRALLIFVDVDGDGRISLEEFKRLFRQFEDEKTSDTDTTSSTSSSRPAVAA